MGKTYYSVVGLTTNKVYARYEECRDADIFKMGYERCRDIVFDIYIADDITYKTMRGVEPVYIERTQESDDWKIVKEEVAN